MKSGSNWFFSARNVMFYVEFIDLSMKSALLNQTILFYLVLIVLYLFFFFLCCRTWIRCEQRKFAWSNLLHANLHSQTKYASTRWISQVFVNIGSNIWYLSSPTLISSLSIFKIAPKIDSMFVGKATSQVSIIWTCKSFYVVYNVLCELKIGVGIMLQTEVIGVNVGSIATKSTKPFKFLKFRLRKRSNRMTFWLLLLWW